jgi:hypothetical protein
MTTNPLTNIALITLDALRYDVAVATPTPNLDAILAKANAGTWRGPDARRIKAEIKTMVGIK